jgi:hypothetical protein
MIFVACSVFGMPYLADIGAEADRVSHSMLQAAVNLGSNTNKPYYVVPVHELQQVSLMQ